MGEVIPKLRASARGQRCTFAIPGVCCFDPSRVVLCHIRDEQKGVANKADDWSSAFGCDQCHEAIDQHRLPKEDELRTILRAMQRTQRIWFVSGLMTFPMTETRARPLTKVVPRPEHFRR
jgi:putative nuclease YbcO-like protein